MKRKLLVPFPQKRECYCHKLLALIALSSPMKLIVKVAEKLG
jgi:hypothetical protein